MCTLSNFQPKQLIRLNPGQFKEAKHVLSDFFESQSISSIRDDLRRWYEAAISSNHPAYNCGDARLNLFLLFNQIELLTEAAYVLSLKNYEEVDD